MFCRLNLLIAIMADSYEKVKESERFEALRERARIIVEMEKRFSKSHQYHRFMHFVEPTESTEQSQEVVWEGVTKRVGQMMRAETSKLEQALASVVSRQDSLEGEMNTKFKLLEDLMNDQFEMLGNKLDTMLDTGTVQ